MAVDSGVEDESFVTRLSDAFHRALFQPMFQKAAVTPTDVRQLIAEFRRKLDLLDEVIAMAEQGMVNGAQRSGGRASFATPSFDEPADAPESDDFDDIGRNQRSRLRELQLLDTMARETRPYSLQQLLSALAGKGFADSSGAVVSQLHRLKKLGLINQPANGMYEVTLDGLGHLRKLRSSFGALIGEGR